MSAISISGIQVDTVALANICLKFGVRELSMFGSAARSQIQPQSDIDLMVEFQPGHRIGLVQFQNLSDSLEQLLGRKVDLVTKRGLKPWIRPHALQDAQLLYEA